VEPDHNGLWWETRDRARGKRRHLQKEASQYRPWGEYLVEPIKSVEDWCFPRALGAYLPLAAPGLKVACGHPVLLIDKSQL
jgi:hypothetical protein